MIKKLLLLISICALLGIASLSHAETKCNIEGTWFASTFAVKFHDGEMSTYVFHEGKAIEKKSLYSVRDNFITICGDLHFECVPVNENKILFEHTAWPKYNFYIIKPAAFYESIKGRWYKTKEHLTRSPEYKWIDFGEGSIDLFQPRTLTACSNENEILTGEYFVQGYNVICLTLPHEKACWTMFVYKDREKFWIGRSDYVRTEGRFSVSEIYHLIGVNSDREFNVPEYTTENAEKKVSYSVWASGGSHPIDDPSEAAGRPLITITTYFVDANDMSLVEINIELADTKYYRKNGEEIVCKGYKMRRLAIDDDGDYIVERILVDNYDLDNNIGFDGVYEEEHKVNNKTIKDFFGLSSQKEI